MRFIMDFSAFTFNPLLPLSGFAVGLLVGLTGVGGGSLMTPLLILLFGFKPATAVGTDLLYAALTKSGGSCGSSPVAAMSTGRLPDAWPWAAYRQPV